MIAGTNLNRLVAGGSFLASCDSPDDRPRFRANRTLTSALIGQYNQLYVTIPGHWFPRYATCRASTNVPRGTRPHVHLQLDSLRAVSRSTPSAFPAFQITGRRRRLRGQRRGHFPDAESQARRRRGRRLYSLTASRTTFITTKDGNHESSNASGGPALLLAAISSTQCLGWLQPHRHRPRQRRHPPR